MITATAALKVLGITDDVTDCECCGKSNLKRTVILGVCDPDGNVMSVVHYGCNCAATALRYKNGRAIEVVAEAAQRAADTAHRSRTVVVGDNDANPGCLWVVEEIGSNGGSVERLCFAKGLRSAIRAWAASEYPASEINVRVAR